MKKLNKTLILLSTSLSLGGIVAPAISETKASAQVIVPDDNSTTDDPTVSGTLKDLEDSINNNVNIDSNGNYHYSYDKIKSIVNSFDFSKINNENGTDFTTDSYLKQATDSLNATQVKYSYVPNTNNINFPLFGMINLASSKGVNKTIKSAWNYTRIYRTHSRTSSVASSYNKLAINWGAAGGATQALDLLGPYGIAAGFALGGTSAANSWYWSTFANSLEKNNGKKGTITDVNKFTTAFKVKPQ